MYVGRGINLRCLDVFLLHCCSLLTFSNILDLGNKHEEKHKMRSKHDQLPLNSTLCFSQSIGSLAWSNFKFPLA